jgi:hypothetical protein
MCGFCRERRRLRSRAEARSWWLHEHVCERVGTNAVLLQEKGEIETSPTLTESTSEAGHEPRTVKEKEDEARKKEKRALPGDLTDAAWTKRASRWLCDYATSCPTSDHAVATRWLLTPRGPHRVTLLWGPLPPRWPLSVEELRAQLGKRDWGKQADRCLTCGATSWVREGACWNCRETASDPVVLRVGSRRSFGTRSSSRRSGRSRKALRPRPVTRH